MSAKAFFGTASDSLEPKVTSWLALPPPPPLSSPPPQAASRLESDTAAPAPRVPLRKPRRLRPAPATDGGMRRARYSDSDRGRDMVASLAWRSGAVDVDRRARAVGQV